MKDNFIEIKGLSKHFGDEQILHNINLSIKNGEFITLLGPSGCGKTTLLKILSGFEEPNLGDVYLNGQTITNIPPEDRQVNMVFQNYALFPHMNVFENVAFGLRCQKISKSKIEDKVNRVLSIVKLDKLKWRKPNQLSGGQQQRVAIARAVVNEPLVLLLDEPLSALDYHLRKNMQMELKQLQRKLGITFVFVTHDQEEALSMSDRIAVMHEGCIEQLGTPREIYEEPCSLQVAQFIGQANIFDSKVLEDGERISFEIENKTFTVTNKKQLTAGQNIHIVVRPEDIAVWSLQEMQNTEKTEALPGVVEQVVYKGSTVDLVVRLASGKKIFATEFFNEDDAKLEYDINEKVWVNWIPDWEVILVQI
ncbi:MAG: spermidine/putrescine ABC transporter ATP-binding protein PotA [Gammaproteobacteria bacterium]|nr:spermidine/putrescine ABC transporter ATP-binding protein PotA [Gammaproteobacteria bacterium]